MWNLWIFAVGVIVAVTGASGLTQSGTAADEAAIRKLADQFPTAWQQADAKALGALWAPDGDYVSSTGQSAKGRAGVEKLFAEQFTGVYKGTSIKTTTAAIRFLKPDVALTEGTFELTGLRGADGNELPTRKGVSTFVLVKDGGKWWIAALRGMVPSLPSRSPST